MTKRQAITRLSEHGALKDMFDRPDNNNIDRAKPITVRQDLLEHEEGIVHQMD